MCVCLCLCLIKRDDADHRSALALEASCSLQSALSPESLRSPVLCVAHFHLLDTPKRPALQEIVPWGLGIGAGLREIDARNGLQRCCELVTHHRIERARDAET